MSSGIEHKQASEQLSWMVAFGAIAVTGELMIGAAAAAGCLAGILLTPDLDVGYWARIHAMRELKKEFPVAGRIWHILWIPYAAAIPHRSPWSHWPILGTVVRLFYLACMLMFLSLFVSSAGGFQPDMVFSWLDVLARWSMTHWFIVGLVVSDTAHWLMDHGV